MEQIEKYKKNVSRAGQTFIFDIFENYVRGEILSGIDALKIYNTIGVPIEIIYLMCVANGLNGINEEEFYALESEQKAMKKYMRQALTGFG